jgi:hypothetical protein
VHCLPGGSVSRNVDSGPEGPATAQADATRLEERGEPEMRTLRLLREERAQISNLIAYRRKGAVEAWFSTSRVLSEPKPSRIVSALQLNA